MEALQETVTESGYTRSIMDNQWFVREHDSRLALAFSQKFDVPEVIGRLLVMRGITLDDAEDYLNPSLKSLLPDPSHLLDMDKAAARLVQAIEQQEKVVVFGDYDVDGATSAALLIRFFQAAGLEIGYYIPDRIEEGYGPNVTAMQRLHQDGMNIVITVDCGAVAYEPLAEAAKLGIEVIVIDHHLGAETLPEAVAVVNPNRLDESTLHRNLAAVGVAFLLVVAVNRLLREQGGYQERKEPNILQWLDLVALGTICDVMTLMGLNRALVAQGLKIMANRQNLGLRVLSDVAGLDDIPGVYHAGFLLGPRINAGGRIGKADLGVRLLTTADADEAYTIALELDKLNKERQALEQLALDEAVLQAEQQEDHPVIIVGSDKWHPGIIGIVASRLKEKFRRPCAVIAWDGDTGKASARSVNGADIGAAVTEARMEGLLEAGGGHAMAAGFTVLKEKFLVLQAFFHDYLGDAVSEHLARRDYPCDIELSASAVTLELVRLLEQLGPYGTGHPEPRVILRNVQIKQTKPAGEHHLMCFLGDGGPTPNPKVNLKAMAFRCMDTKLGKALQSHYQQDVHLAGKVKINRWQGIEKAEFYIDDMVV